MCFQMLGGLGGDRLKAMLFAVLAGMVLFWNENQVDVSVIQESAIEIDSQEVGADTALSGKLVSVSGPLRTDELIGDDLFLKPDQFIVVNRTVEMYRSVRKSGSSQTVRYEYKWTRDLDPSLAPAVELEGQTKTAQTAAIGAYSFDPATVDFNLLSRLELHSQNLHDLDQNYKIVDNYIFIPSQGPGDYRLPVPGDIRVSYYVAHTDSYGTLFGQVSGNRIEPFLGQTGNRLFNLYLGTKEKAISTEHSGYIVKKWFFRIAAFLALSVAVVALIKK